MATGMRGLYVITAGHQGAELACKVAEAIDGGARMIQYRDKSDDGERRLNDAWALVELCRARGVPLIVNDDVELAVRVGAAGVHLGRDDTALEEARQRLGPDAILGVSCYDDLERAARLAAAGADYLAFGAFFPSPTKPAAVRAGLGLLHEAARRWPGLPRVAIGGITPANGAPLVAAGADLIAAITGVFGAADVTAAARAYAALFE